MRLKPVEVDVDAANKLVMEHIELVKTLAARMSHRVPAHVEFNELVSVGMMGLVEAARRYQPALGVPFERRGAMSSDYLAAIKTAWTSDPASYSGPFVHFREVQTGPPPVRSPHPPVWVGGGSEAAMRRAVRLGDAWHPIRIRVPALRDSGIPKLREIADKEGRPIPAVCRRASSACDGRPICGSRPSATPPRSDSRC